MGGGILSGLMWGTMTSVMVLGIASQMAPLPRSSLEPVAAVTPAPQVRTDPLAAQAPSRPESAIGPLFGVDAAPRVAAAGVAAAAAEAQEDVTTTDREPAAGAPITLPTALIAGNGGVRPSMPEVASDSRTGSRVAKTSGTKPGPIEFDVEPEHPGRAPAEALAKNGADAVPAVGDTTDTVASARPKAAGRAAVQDTVASAKVETGAEAATSEIAKAKTQTDAVAQAGADSVAALDDTVGTAAPASSDVTSQTEVAQTETAKPEIATAEIIPTDLAQTETASTPIATAETGAASDVATETVVARTSRDALDKTGQTARATTTSEPTERVTAQLVETVTRDPAAPKATTATVNSATTMAATASDPGASIVADSPTTTPDTAPKVDGAAPEPIVLAAAAPSASPNLLSQARASMAQSLQAVTEQLIPDDEDASVVVKAAANPVSASEADQVETTKAEDLATKPVVKPEVTVATADATPPKAQTPVLERPSEVTTASVDAASEAPVQETGVAEAQDQSGALPQAEPQDAAPVQIAALDTAPDVPVSPIDRQTPLADNGPTRALDLDDLVREEDPSAEPVSDPEPAQDQGVQLAQARTAPVANDAAPSGFGKRVVPLTERNTSQGGVIRRTSTTERSLPRIGDAAPEADTADAAPSEEAAPSTGTALERFAAKFDNPESRPKVSIILIDAGTGGIPRRALLDMPVSVTFAVDPSAEGAADAARTYRAAGFEVLVLAQGLPRTARAEDVETAFGAWISDIPEAVGVIDSADGRLAKNRSASEQLSKALAADGHGLVLYDKGLNSAVAAAEEEGVKSGLAFRALDERNENISTIGRYLDRAAFRAAQEGDVILVGHTYEATVQAVLKWALEGRGTSMAVAPISAVLLDDS